MKTNTKSLYINSRNISAQQKLIKILFVLMLPLTACGGGSPVDESQIRTQVALEAQQTALSESLTSAAQASNTPPPTDTPRPEQPTEAPTSASAQTATTGPQCTVLQDLNFREGPGRAYPIIVALPLNTVVVPLAYNPDGIPSGGPWVQVEHPTNGQKGWLSAGSQFINCNLDLTTLPSVTVAPPPTPVPPRAQTSNPDGDCGDGGEYDCEVILSGGLPIQIIITRNGQEIGGEQGVQVVEFRVSQDGNEFYSHDEQTSAYCMFGGEAPCSTWVFEDNVYKWGSGGVPVEAGEYRVFIQVFIVPADGSPRSLRWFGNVTVSP